MPMHAPNQSHFDFILPPGEFLTVKQIAAACGFSNQHILDAFAEGKLMGYESNARSKKGKEARYAKRIPRKFAVLFLARIANYDEGSLADNICAAIDTGSRQLALQVQQRCARRLARWN